MTKQDIKGTFFFWTQFFFHISIFPYYLKKQILSNTDLNSLPSCFKEFFLAHKEQFEFLAEKSYEIVLLKIANSSNNDDFKDISQQFKVHI